MSQLRVAAPLTSDATVSPLASQTPTRARITAFVDLAHAPRSEGRKDFVGAELVAGR
jgi:hypothetical protein